MESAVAMRSLQTMGRGSVVNTIRLTLEFPRGVSALDDAGWTATTRVARWLVADSAVQRVRSLPGLVAPMGTFIPRDTLVSMLPAAVRRSFMSEDGHIALLEVIPRETSSPRELSALVAPIALGGHSARVARRPSALYWSADSRRSTSITSERSQVD